MWMWICEARKGEKIPFDRRIFVAFYWQRDDVDFFYRNNLQLKYVSTFS